MSEEGIRLTFTEQGKEQFDLSESPEYQYWFDIVTPKNGAVSLANYDWSLTDEGKKKLKELGIPEEFAAIVERSYDQSKSYYFAGDYNDVKRFTTFLSNERISIYL